jgi:hypothetical protein
MGRRRRQRSPTSAPTSQPQRRRRKAVRDDTDDFVGNVVHHVLLANEHGEHYELPSKLTEDEQLQVAILVSAEEEPGEPPRLRSCLPRTRTARRTLRNSSLG